MAKAASPVRLQEELMQEATLTARRFHRSTAEQIEFWASLGQKVSSVLDPDDLLSVASGLAKIRIEPVYAETVNPEAVFQHLEEQRTNGSLVQEVTYSSFKYQTSKAHPGYLEQIDQQGNIKTGKFVGGEFIVLRETDS